MPNFKENFVMPEHLEFPEKSMYQLVADTAEKYPNAIAYEFYNKETSYPQFIERIERTARAFTEFGVQAEERVTICLPNTPQALDCYYALNRLNITGNMIHPQSAQTEIAFYLRNSDSKVIVTVDMFYEKVLAAVMDVDPDIRILVVRIQDELPRLLAPAYTAKAGRQYLKYPTRSTDMLWKKFLKLGDKRMELPEAVYNPEHIAAILYSGGSTGTPKGICLSDMNFNACAMQTIEGSGLVLDDEKAMLSCMPIFHGFGLCINIHCMLIMGCKCILMPTFNLDTYTKMLKKKHPTFIAGVPTIFEALLHMDKLEGTDLSFLTGVFSGGDSLAPALKARIDDFLHEHGATIQIREGYGLTECITAVCMTPMNTHREGSIGLPLPDVSVRIVEPGTFHDKPVGEEGEILVCGPSVMMGYLNNPEETEITLRKDTDGKTWLYTGDIGRIDEENYLYYCARLKRMIITNGYNVYPGQLESIINSCEDVAYSCVIGIPDVHRMQKVKAFIVLNDDVTPGDQIKEQIKSVLKKNVARYAIPREIEFRSELPKNLVGKIAYRVLEEEELAKIAAREAKAAAEKEASEKEASEKEAADSVPADAKADAPDSEEPASGNEKTA